MPTSSSRPLQPSLHQTPDILVLGHVCIDRMPDELGGGERLGGAAAFASQIAAVGHAKVGLVTAAPASFSRLKTLTQNPYIALHRQDCAHGHVFEMHGGRNTPRRERAISVAPSLHLAQVPDAWRHAPVAYIAPILGECNGAVVAALHAKVVVVGAQGWLRTRSPDGWVQYAAGADFVQPPSNVTALVFSEADHPDALGAAAALQARGHLAVVTQGRRGGVLFAGGQEPRRYAAYPANEVDPTGAGDCFGVVLALELAQGTSLAQAAELAARAAARVVEGPELGSLDEMILARSKKLICA